MRLKGKFMRCSHLDRCRRIFSFTPGTVARYGWRVGLKPSEVWDVITSVESVLSECCYSYEYYMGHRNMIAEVAYILEQAVMWSASSRNRYLEGNNYFGMRRRVSTLILVFARTILKRKV